MKAKSRIATRSLQSINVFCIGASPVPKTHFEAWRRSALVPGCYRWRLVIDRPFHGLIYLFGCEKHGRLRAGRPC